MDTLVSVNIRLYKERPASQPKGKKGSQWTPRISHEFYFWNIIVLSQLLPNPEITELVGTPALTQQTRPFTSQTPFAPRRP